MVLQCQRQMAKDGTSVLKVSLMTIDHLKRLKANAYIAMVSRGKIMIFCVVLWDRHLQAQRTTQKVREITSCQLSSARDMSELAKPIFRVTADHDIMSSRPTYHRQIGRGYVLEIMPKDSDQRRPELRFLMKQSLASLHQNNYCIAKPR